MPDSLNSPNRRILIVDDNPAIHSDFDKILAPAGVGDDVLDDLNALMFGPKAATGKITIFALDHAHQGQEALAKVEAGRAAGLPFAMAFIDVRMPPGWDGIETVSRIWKVDPDLQVVICTAYSDYDWDDITARLGPSDNLLILKKPFDQIEALQLAHALTNKWNLSNAARHHAAALEIAQEERRQASKMEAVGQLAAGVAHDFNNMLTVVLGYARLELADTAPGSRNEESLNCILGAAERAANLTRQLLAFSRKQILQPSLMDLNSCISKMEPMLRPLVGAKIKLMLQLAANLPAIVADSISLDQIILNLALNARDAMPNGGAIQIHTSLEEVSAGCIPPSSNAARPGPHICITVKDSGIGMDAETARHLFEPFFTTKEVGKGTGMGLATVHGIVHQHGGWITVDTALGQGTSFQVYLPVAGADSESPKPAQPLLTSLSNTGAVLLVEDEESVNLMAASVISKQGFNVLSAYSAAEALRIWESHGDEIVLLFTDMVMPGQMFGYDVARRIWTDRPALPVIFSSGYSRDLFNGKVDLKEGVNYLPKPYRPVDLSDLISTVIATGPVNTEATLGSCVAEAVV